MTDFMKGLSILVWGWGASFVAMAVFMGLILLLRKIFPHHEESVEAETEEAAEPTTVVKAEAASEDEEISVAISTAIVYLRSRSQAQLGKSLENGQGQWWKSNRLSARESTPLRK